MLKSSRDKWMLRSSTFLVWAAAAACAVFWGLKMSRAPSASGVAPVESGRALVADSAALARVLGAPQGAVTAAPVASSASRFVLKGVLAGNQNGGAALIALDGKPARPVRVGEPVEPGVVLQSVRGRQALLGPERDGPATLTLEMAPLTP